MDSKNPNSVIDEDQIRSYIDRRLSVEDQQVLNAEVTQKEIKQVLFFLARNKSPGPDGFSVEFFIDT